MNYLYEYFLPYQLHIRNSNTVIVLIAYQGRIEGGLSERSSWGLQNTGIESTDFFNSQSHENLVFLKIIRNNKK